MQTAAAAKNAAIAVSMRKAQDHLVDAFPLASPEWAAWSAAMRTPRLAGRWALAGYEIGKGPVYGQLTIADRPDTPDGVHDGRKFTYTKTGRDRSRAKSRANRLHRLPVARAIG